MRNKNTSDSSSNSIALNKHITANRRVWRQGWKKTESANRLIRSGKVIHSKTALLNPHTMVDKNLRFSITPDEDRLSTKKLDILKSISRKYIPSRVWQMFWRRWGDGVVTNMGKDFVMEKGRRYSFFKYRFLIRKSVKTFYSLDNKNFKEMSERGSQWPTTAGYSYKFFRNMERRLDVTLVRLGYALNLEHARTLIKEGSISVDDRIIKRADYLLSAASTVKAVYPNLPFVLLYREHLKHYPHTWLKFRKRKGRTRHKGSWGATLRTIVKKNGQTLDSPVTTHSIMTGLSSTESFKVMSWWKRKRLKKVLKWKGGAFKRKIGKPTTKLPLTHVGDQLVCTSMNQALFTHFYKHKDIKLPQSIQVLTF